jgi:hypothetical protein
MSISPARKRTFLIRLSLRLWVSCWEPCKSFASGFTWASESESSPDESPELEDPSLCRRRFRARSLDAATHSGTGCSRSNCRRRRSEYTLPLTVSSSVLILSFRRRGADARETVIRSSSLSSQAGGSRVSLVGGSSTSSSSSAARSVAAGPSSKKKSYSKLAGRPNS